VCRKSIIPGVHSFFPLALSVVLISVFLLPHSLRKNIIGDEGAAAFGEALKSNRTLTSLE
jgi:hypothetical protein